MWIVIALAILAGLIFLLIAPARKADMSAFEGHDFAHRGLHDNSGDAPENSLRAFEKACQAGYGIELDVRYSKDGVIVVFHDDDLKRVCGVDAPVSEKTAAELKSIRLAKSDETIPTFDEALKVIGGRVPMIVEIKTGPDVQKLTREVIDRLKEYDGAYCLESFNPLAMGAAKKYAPEVIRGQLVACYGEMKKSVGALAILLSNLLLNAFSRPHFIARDIASGRNIFCRMAEAMGASTALWTLRTEESYAAARPKDIRITELWNK